MIFLQPLVLLALPLILAPVVIHLLNRMRHRPKPWAAMRFLISATRSSVSHAKLRQFLILACRVLAVAMLILFVARPLAGGWLGWALSPAPDAILILLDRSASMETQAGSSTRRAEALQLLIKAAQPFEQSSHLVLIDSATRVPQEIAHAATLAQSVLTQPTSTAADWPGMLGSAFEWLMQNKAGAAEIWIASDGQRSNWQSENGRWPEITAQLGALGRKVRVRLLQMDQPAEPNVSVALREWRRRPQAGGSALEIVLDVQRNRAGSATIPLTLTVNGARSDLDVTLESSSLRWRHAIDLGADPAGGWGSVTLPSDGNAQDNSAYFVYSPAAPLSALVVGGAEEASRSLKFAAGSAGKPAQWIAPANFQASDLAGRSLLVWAAPLPSGAAATAVRDFADSGGVEIFLPPGQVDQTRFNGMGWGGVEDAAQTGPWHLTHWEEDDGPLARSDERISLPLNQTTFHRRQIIQGSKNTLAAFDDGAAFLARQSLGRGQIYFCSSLPETDWSSLDDGPVLVPMLQRLLQAGGGRGQQALTAVCGELSAADLALPWVSVDSALPKDIRTQAGVYRAGARLLAVNRPAGEDDPEELDAVELRRVFGGLPVQAWEEKRPGGSQLQGEIWRSFLFAMLLFLLGEGWLTLPPALRKQADPAKEKTPFLPREQAG